MCNIYEHFRAKIFSMIDYTFRLFNRDKTHANLQLFKTIRYFVSQNMINDR